MIKVIQSDKILNVSNIELVLNNRIEGLRGEIQRITNRPVDLSDLGCVPTTFNVNNERTHGTTGNNGFSRVVQTVTFNTTVDAYISVSPDGPSDAGPIANLSLKVDLIYERIQNFRDRRNGSRNANNIMGWVNNDALEPVPPLVIREDTIPKPREQNEISYVRTEHRHPTTLNAVVDDAGASVTVNGNVGFTRTGFVWAERWRSGLNNRESWGVNLFNPLRLEFCLDGDTFNMTPIPFATTNSLVNTRELPRNNTFLMNTSTINGENIANHMENKIVRDWSDGKITLSITVSLAKSKEIFKVGEIITIPHLKLLNLNLDIPKDRQFKIIQAEFIYDGSRRQVLHLQEYGEVVDYDREVQHARN